MNYRFDKGLVWMVLELLFIDISLDRRDDLEEIGILGNYSMSNLVLKLVLGR